MAMALRTEIDLPTLRISLDLATSDVVFATVRGHQEPQEVARCDHDDLHLPRSIYDEVDDGRLTIPVSVVDALSATLRTASPSAVRPHNALWLELPAPRGLLPVVPWERLLARLDRPLYRLPFHPVRPQRPSDGLNVALTVHAAAGPAAAAELAKRVVEQYRRNVPGVVVHVFTDVSSQHAVQDRLADRCDTGEVVVHRPATELSHHATASGVVTNPWLRWMLGAADGGRIDVVHVVCPAWLADGHGALALPDPADSNETPDRLVESVEIVELLTRVGAVALTLSTPGTPQGAAALRELADDVSRLRPGLATVHDLATDPDAEQLGVALGTVLSPTDEAAVLPAMSTWLNPLFADAVPAVDGTAGANGSTWTSRMRLRDDGRSAILPDTTRAAGAEQPEAWVASANRSIEQLHQSWTPSDADRPVDPAAVEALSRVSHLLDGHLPTGREGTSTPEPSEGGTR